jgi:aryl-alcohol dehydrogenase-like predicted oxidoreductase
MRYTHLGRSGLTVSRLCLGTMNFGPLTGEEESHRIMDAALEAGINFFDTANVYGWRRGEGVTERIVGTWFAKGGERRDRTVIATKVYGSMGDWPNQSQLSARHIISSCHESLRRLQTDRIDLLQMHHVDRRSPWEEIWQAFETLVAQGKVIYAGSSNFAGWHLAQAQESARARRFLGLVSEQSLYNLLDRTVELEVLPAALDYGLGVIPWSPLARGLLGGVLRKDKQARTAERAAQARLEQHRSAIEQYEKIADDIGEHPSNLGLAWLLHQRAVTAPIIGPRTIDQFEVSLRAIDLALDTEVLAALDNLFPGPGGPAPEAYAW